MKILLSIKPKYAHKIINGEKKYEYRKVIPKSNIESILIYSSYPEKKIIGEITVKNILSYSPSKMWEETKSNAGISRDNFRKYFKGVKTAYAFEIGDVKCFEQPKELKDYNLLKAPQSFFYLKD